MHFAETLNQNVAGFGVLFDLDGRVFFLNAVQTGDNLIVLALLLRGNSQRNRGFREVDGRKDDLVACVAERIARCGILQFR
ncbi:hypothetical protein SDC9_161495 [bioreactor metagenome]|uniref:Uncharacterized protein n=1 Tax=bioreactor metagenome TaxID=1076179 RepID=A0A645FLF7_9ZZZZ